MPPARARLSRPFMEPWRPVGRRPTRDEPTDKALQRWWEAAMWGALFVWFVAPTLLLWGWAWIGGLRLDAGDWRLGLNRPWWGCLALVSAFNAYHAHRALRVFLWAAKERLYRRSARIGADFGMAAFWAGAHALGVWGLAGDCGCPRPPAASLAALGLLMAAAFGAGALKGLLRGSRSLRVTEQSPARAGDFPRHPDLPGRLKLAHLSDLHLTRHPGVLAVGGILGGNSQFRALLRRHAGRLRRQDGVLISGDIADGGRACEWRVFFSDWERLGLSARTVLVPGNHEININDPDDWVAVDPAHVLRAKRLVRTLAALDRVQGERAWVWGPQGPLRLREHLAPHADRLRDFIDDPALGTRGRWWLRMAAYLATGRWWHDSARVRERLALPARVWRGAFPMLVELPGQDALVLVLDSNVTATGVWDNALGRVEPDQLERLRRLCADARFAARPKLLALHHHVALPPLRWSFFRDLQADMMSLLDPKALVGALPPGRRVVLHGHKHLAYFGRLHPGLQVVSAPSSTLPDERRPRRPLGFYSFTAALARGRDESALAGPPRFNAYEAWAPRALDLGAGRP